MSVEPLQAMIEKNVNLITDDRSVRAIGIMILAATFGVLGTWGFFAPLDGAALATGYVTVKSHRKTIQHLDGGIVSELLAKDGDIIKEGDILIRLDTTEIKAQLQILRGQYITLAAQLARLQAERDLLKEIKFPDDLRNQSDPLIIEAREGEIHIFNARKSAYEGEILVLQQQSNQLSSKLKGLQGQRSSKQILMKSYSEEVVDLKELLAEGYTNQLRLRDTERSYATNSGEIAELTADIASSEIQISELKLKILQIQKNFQENVTEKLGEAQAKLYDVTQRLVAATDKMTRTDIKAPANGRVLGLSVHTIGGVITPGLAILDIVPQKEELIIDAQVSAIDIDRVRVGLLAEVRFSSFNLALTPKMEGKVINLSADHIIDEKTGIPHYQAVIELTPDSYTKLGNLELLPGMPVEVLIRTGERTVFEYLMQPITNSLARAFIED